MHLRNGSGNYDEEIQSKFAVDFKKLAEGDYDNWFDDSDGILAIILMFQFFTKYMFRGDKRSYQFEVDAICLAKYIVEKTDYQKMYTDYQMLLVVTPLGFSEEPADNLMAINLIAAKIEHYRMQGKGVPRYEQHIKMMQASLDEFIAHNEVVRQFSRDPRRNLILGRESKEEEEVYL